MAPKGRKPLVEVSEKYELYAEWLQSEHELEVPADYLQVALRFYSAFQKSDVNRAANAARAEASAAAKDEAPARTKKSKAKKQAEVVEDDDDEDDDDEEEEAAPPAKPAKATKAVKGKGKAAF